MTNIFWDKERILEHLARQSLRLGEGNDALLLLLEKAFAGGELDDCYVVTSHYDILIYRDTKAASSNEPCHLELSLEPQNMVGMNLVCHPFLRAENELRLNLKLRWVGVADSAHEAFLSFVHVFRRLTDIPELSINKIMPQLFGGEVEEPDRKSLE